MNYIEYVEEEVREEIFEGDSTNGYKLTKFDSKKPIITVIGGSLGAEKLNKLIRENLDEFLEDSKR